MSGAISDQTTVLSNLSLNGNFQTASLLSSADTISAAKFLTTGAANSSFGTLAVVSGLILGAGTQITNSFASTAAVAAITCQATSSTSTLLTHNSISTSHFLTIHPPSGSGLSSGLVLNIQPGSAASTAVLTFSNASTVAAVTTAGAVYRIMGIKFGGV